MASKKNDVNTSKTAHVMNLLSRGRTPVAPPANDSDSKPETAPAESSPAPAAAQQPATAPAAAPQNTPAPQAPPRGSPIISIMNADADASASIKEALEAALLEEETQAASQQPPAPAAPEPPHIQSPAEPVPQSAHQVQDSAPMAPEPPLFPEKPVPKPEPVIPEPVPPLPEETAPAAEPPEEPPVQAEPPAAQTAAAEAAITPPVEEVPPAAAPPSDQPAPAYSRVNVMELLVEEAVDRYIKMFGLCNCDRCRSDVTALALSNLPPKYMVMTTSEISPRLSIYRGRFSSAVTAQILHACKAVFDSPRHDLP